MVKIYFHPEKVFYDGSNLQSLYAYRNFDLQGDSIIAFRGSCLVKEHLVDLADKKNNAFIQAQEMLHFIIEHFGISLEEAILRQRLFICLLEEYCFAKKIFLKREGDDLFFAKRKLNVSIATQSPVSSLIHCGINITNEETPIPTAAIISDFGLDPEVLAKALMLSYQKECTSMNLARCKVLGVK